MKHFYITRIGWVVIVAVVIIAIATPFLISGVNNLQDKIAIEIVAVPEDAVINLNGLRVSNGVNYIKPGEYTVTGYKDGFDRMSYSVKIVDAHQKVFVLLSASSDAAKLWTSNNLSKYYSAQAAASQQVTSDTKNLLAKNPIIAKLPYENDLFKIAYKLDLSDASGESIIVTISAPEQYRSMAIAEIADLGFNPSDYNYEFSDFTNVFMEVQP